MIDRCCGSTRIRVSPSDLWVHFMLVAVIISSFCSVFVLILGEKTSPAWCQFVGSHTLVCSFHRFDSVSSTEHTARYASH